MKDSNDYPKFDWNLNKLSQITQPLREKKFIPQVLKL